jgi:hypothetical protein
MHNAKTNSTVPAVVDGSKAKYVFQLYHICHVSIIVPIDISAISLLQPFTNLSLLPFPRFTRNIQLSHAFPSLLYSKSSLDYHSQDTNQQVAISLVYHTRHSITLSTDNKELCARREEMFMKDIGPWVPHPYHSNSPQHRDRVSGILQTFDKVFYNSDEGSNTRGMR